MAKALEATEPKIRKEITDFREKYKEALVEARVTAEHTSTAGWVQLYHLHQNSVNDKRKELGEQLEELARTMKRGGMSEDDEKQLGEIKKTSVELRADINAFTRKALIPVQEPVMECQRVIEEARRTARAAEAQSPLTHRGLLVEMDDAIASVEKVTFEMETGTVQIK